MNPLALLTYLGLKKAVVKALANPKANLVVHFGGPEGEVVGYINDYSGTHYRTIIATPAVFNTGTDARAFLNGLLALVRAASTVPA